MHQQLNQSVSPPAQCGAAFSFLFFKEPADGWMDGWMKFVGPLCLVVADLTMFLVLVADS